RETLRESGSLFVVADGMGGVTGGAEASRAAVRALAGSFIENAAQPNGEPGDSDELMADRMRGGFAAANRQVLELSRENPSLRDMGTTLTAANLNGSRLVLGHVGDSRCLLLRDGRLAQLTEDHAVRSPDNYLTRCVGGGQERVRADVAHHRLQVGDRVVLLTDGLWSVVGEQEIARVVRGTKPRLAAQELVRQANRSGGPDNSTVLIVHVRSVDANAGDLQSVELPSEEVRQPSNLRLPDGSLVAPKWPWLLLALSLLLLALAATKILFEVDLADVLMSYLRGLWD
ncbi:MAG: PP2C family protein-serine/threonine phosphatase, partial [Planctomycetota bacterium]